MSGEIKYTFCTDEQDGRFCVLTPDWEVIGSFEKESDATEFEMNLNMLCTDAAEITNSEIAEQ